jgi:hypothetical protein
MMTASLIRRFCFALVALTLTAPTALALTDQVPREQDIVDLRLGQRIQVDDGSCPAGSIKEVSGTRMSAAEILRTRKCVPRQGPEEIGERFHRTEDCFVISKPMTCASEMLNEFNPSSNDRVSFVEIN